MPDRLPVHVNRKQLHSMEVPPSFETDDSFVIEVQNHGEAGRVHVHLDEDLSEVASVEASNHYVKAKATEEITVSVHDRRELFGKIKLVSGYGATTRWVNIQLTEPDDSRTVVVDEELSKPQPRDPEPERSSIDPNIAKRPTVPVLGFGAIAICIAVGAAIYLKSAVVAVGAGVVILSVIFAAYLLLT